MTMARRQPDAKGRVTLWSANKNELSNTFRKSRLEDEMHQGVGDTMSRPPIAIEERHYARLFDLASKADGPTNIGDYLREELERARKVSFAEWNPEVVSLGSTVEFRCEHTGRIQEIMLVYPSEADIERRRVSVMTRIGAALIGLSPNQTISFRNMFGDRRELTVINVVAPK